MGRGRKCNKDATFCLTLSRRRKTFIILLRLTDGFSRQGESCHSKRINDNCKENQDLKKIQDDNFTDSFWTFESITEEVLDEGKGSLDHLASDSLSPRLENILYLNYWLPY